MMNREFQDERLATNFMLSEFLASETAERRGIDNTPTGFALQNLRQHTGPGMQRIRDLLNRLAFVYAKATSLSRSYGVIITSGYRCDELNRAIGGSRISHHMEGLAADFIVPSWGSPRKAALIIAEHQEDIQFDQLIMEGTWVHVSFAEAPRGEVLTATFGAAGLPHYQRGIA